MKKLWALVLAGCLAAVLSTAAWASETSTTVDTPDGLTNALGDATVTSIQLTGNIDISSTLVVTRDVTLDLNGHVLRLKEGSSGSVIAVEKSTLTLVDNNPSAEHKFTVDSDDKPWRLDETNGTEKVYGGVITGGTGGTYSYLDPDKKPGSRHSDCGGGVYVGPDATFIMQGGNIVGCSARDNGGGVFVADNFNPSSRGTFVMSSGTISGCTSSDGGGVYSSGTTKLSGNATIKNCRANGQEHSQGGGGVHCTYILTISDSVKITECKANNGDAIFARYFSSITGGTFDGSVKFDGSNVTVSGGTFNGDVSGAHVVTFDAQGGTPEPETQIRANAAATRPTDPTKDGYKFEGWYTDAKYTTKYTFTENEKVTASMTLYAKWTEKQDEQPKYYYKASDSGETTETKGSPKTFDAGMGVYAGMAVLSLAGMACVGKKLH